MSTKQVNVSKEKKKKGNSKMKKTAIQQDSTQTIAAPKSPTCKREWIDMLSEITEDHVKFLDQYGTPNVCIFDDGKTIIYTIQSEIYQIYIIKKIRDLTNLIINKKILNEFIDYLKASTLIDGIKFNLNQRVALYNNKIYFDLCNSEYSCIVIDDNGWTIEKNAPILFKREKHQKEQVMPAKGGNILDIFKYLNIKNNRILFLSTFLTMFIPKIEHPILNIYGQAGCGKSTATKVLKKLLDPSENDILSFPSRTSDLPLIISKHWLIPFDNISNIKDNVSDILCQAVSGIAISKRKNYTDADEVVFNLKNCLILNGIYQSATRNDLLDRSILFELNTMSNKTKITSKQFWDDFYNDLPKLVGSIFDIIVKARNIYNNIDVSILANHSKHRLTDFQLWGFCIAEAIGNKGNAFLKQLDKAIVAKNEEAIVSNPLASALQVFLENNKPKGIPLDSWKGRPIDLLKALNDIAKDQKMDTYSQYWARGAQALTRKLNGIQKDLLAIGIKYTHEGKGCNGAKILLEKIK